MFESCRGRFSDQGLWTSADSTDVLERAIAHPIAHPFRGRLTRCRDRYDNAGNDRGSCACTTGATRSPGARRTCRRPCTARSAKPRRELARFVTEVGDGAHSSTKSTSVGELLEQWFSHNEADWSPTVVNSYRRIIDRQLVPALRSHTAATVDHRRHRSVLRAAAQARRRARGGPLAPASVKRVHAVLRRALAQAVKWGLITINPAVNASPPREPRHEVSPPDPADVARLIAHAEETNPPLGCFLRLAATSGARRGELCALRWKHVDVDKGALLIERSIVENGEGRARREGHEDARGAPAPPRRRHRRPVATTPSRARGLRHRAAQNRARRRLRVLARSRRSHALAPGIRDPRVLPTPRRSRASGREAPRSPPLRRDDPAVRRQGREDRERPPRPRERGNDPRRLRPLHRSRRRRRGRPSRHDPRRSVGKEARLRSRFLADLQVWSSAAQHIDRPRPRHFREVSGPHALDGCR